ncbi:hypothetical protein [Halomonas sp. H5]|uniref:hypothetical protein n=1 Tax=Halomonas sp. H5 TaxID=3423910 RepID=UPI003D365DE6
MPTTDRATDAPAKGSRDAWLDAAFVLLPESGVDSVRTSAWLWSRTTESTYLYVLKQDSPVTH